MQQPLILWVNLTGECGMPLLCERLENHCRVQRCEDPRLLRQLLATLIPGVICFDCASPEAAERTLIQRIKLEYPSVPLLMFTTGESAELMIWALRTRVWDCFIKPVSCGEVMRRLNILLPVLGTDTTQRARTPLMPERSACASSLQQEKTAPSRTATVLPYLQRHFHEKIVLSDLARTCDMNSFEFSRCFRREQGVTFRDYLMRLRIEVAARRLRRDGQSVLDVACSVGFNDPSQFARLFRRHMGVTPTGYRIEQAPALCTLANGQELAIV